MTLYSLKDYSPHLYEPSTCWFAPNCNIIGKVVIFGNVSVWFGAVIRGDNEEIEIGDGSNIQENSILHTDMGWPLLVGAGCTIGHGCILHGCKLGSNSLVGMGSTLLNGAEIGKDCIIGAGSLLVQKQVIPNGSLVFGRPGKVIRHLSQEEIHANKNAARLYSDKINAYRNGLKVIPN
jgi:carbonic anhydrase/acetyltransferase-like protein (isoleucine patch superfamily)